MKKLILKITQWCIKQLFYAECGNHINCQHCHYNMEDTECVLLDVNKRISE